MSKASPSSSSTTASSWKSCFRNDLFHGKVALVSGGGTGIGKAIATELALLGAIVVIASRSTEKCQKTADEINDTIQKMAMKKKDDGNNGRSDITTTSSRGKVVVGPSTNIRKEEDIKQLISHTIEAYGSLDLLVNNAGGQFIADSADISKRGFHAVVETNLYGTFLMCREAYNQYMSDNGGSIVNITIGNRNGMPGMMHSAASRAGVENMTASLCVEWIESNVRINCVRPGIIYTDSGYENYGPAGEYFISKITKSLPSRRLGTAEEIASATTWLLSDGASYVTGSIICVDGGGSYTSLPLVDIEDKTHLSIYGTLPSRAKL